MEEIDCKCQTYFLSLAQTAGGNKLQVSRFFHLFYANLNRVAMCNTNLRASTGLGLLARTPLCMCISYKDGCWVEAFSINTTAKGGNTVPLLSSKALPSFINLQASSPPATLLKILPTKLPAGIDHKPKGIPRTLK